MPIRLNTGRLRSAATTGRSGGGHARNGFGLEISRGSGSGEQLAEQLILMILRIGKFNNRARQGERGGRGGRVLRRSLGGQGIKGSSNFRQAKGSRTKRGMRVRRGGGRGRGFEAIRGIIRRPPIAKLTHRRSRQSKGEQELESLDRKSVV